MNKKMIFALLVLCLSVSSRAADEENTITLKELKMQHRFGMGVSAGGPLSTLGLEVDVNFTENFSVGAGIGTAMDYSSAMVKARYFLLGKSVSPYFAAGFARWWSQSPTKRSDLHPGILNNFIGKNEDISNGFDCYIFYPAFGVQVMSVMGLGFFAEVEYLFRLFNMANGTYAGLGVHWYF